MVVMKKSKGPPKRSLDGAPSRVRMGREPGPSLVPGWAPLLAPNVGPPFRPDQKVKLDKGEARRGGLSLFVRHDFLGDGDGHTSTLLTGHVTFLRWWGRKSVRTVTGVFVMKQSKAPAQAKLGRVALDSW